MLFIYLLLLFQYPICCPGIAFQSSNLDLDTLSTQSHCISTTSRRLVAVLLSFVVQPTLISMISMVNFPWIPLDYGYSVVVFLDSGCLFTFTFFSFRSPAFPPPFFLSFSLPSGWRGVRITYHIYHTLASGFLFLSFFFVHFSLVVAGRIIVFRVVLFLVYCYFMYTYAVPFLLCLYFFVLFCFVQPYIVTHFFPALKRFLHFTFTAICWSSVFFLTFLSFLLLFSDSESRISYATSGWSQCLNYLLSYIVW